MAWGSWFPKSYLQQTVGVTRVDLVSFKGQKHTSGEHNRGVSYSGISELHRYGGFREPTNRSAGTAQILLPLLFFPCLCANASSSSTVFLRDLLQLCGSRPKFFQFVAGVVPCFSRGSTRQPSLM